MRSMNRFLVSRFALWAGGLFAAYAALLAVANGPAHVWEQFLQLWYFIIPLTAGFGVQGMLFSFLRAQAKLSAAAVAGTGGVSAGSMAACCVHHATDVVPLLGLSVVGTVLAEFQAVFLALGLLSNLVGITMLLHMVQKHGLAPETGLGKRLFSADMGAVRKGAAVGSAVVFTLLVAFSAAGGPAVAGATGPGAAGSISVAPQTQAQNGLTVTVAPDIQPGQPVRFSVQLTTHSGSLDERLEEISTLRDAAGNTVAAASWDGSPPGGHHRSGTLTFPPMPAPLELRIAGLRQADWVFSWTQ